MMSEIDSILPPAGLKEETARVRPSQSEDGKATMSRKERLRQDRLDRTSAYIAKRALDGEPDFPANYYWLRHKQPKDAGDWRAVQERLASDGIMVDVYEMKDLDGLHGDYSHMRVNVTAIPQEYSPKH